MSFERDKFDHLLTNAFYDRPNRSLGERNLFRHCADALEWRLPTADDPDLGRQQLARSTVFHVEAVLHRHLSEELLAAVDVESAGGAAALLARVLDPDRSADFVREIAAELEAT